MADDIVLTESQKKICDVLDGIKDLLLDKNRKYGDSALHPKNTFFKGNSTNSILMSFKIFAILGELKYN